MGDSMKNSVENQSGFVRESFRTGREVVGDSEARAAACDAAEAFERVVGLAVAGGAIELLESLEAAIPGIDLGLCLTVARARRSGRAAPPPGGDAA